VWDSSSSRELLKLDDLPLIETPHSTIQDLDDGRVWEPSFARNREAFSRPVDSDVGQKVAGLVVPVQSGRRNIDVCLGSASASTPVCPPVRPNSVR
jgi:hypothetical protein